MPYAPRRSTTSPSTATPRSSNCVAERSQIRAPDRQTEVVEPAAPRLPLPSSRQEIDQLGAESELHQGDALVHVIERAAEDFSVEAARDLLVLDAQDDVVEAQGLEERHGRRDASNTTNATPASITAPFSTVDSRWSREKLTASTWAAPVGACRMASRAACAAGSTTSQA